MRISLLLLVLPVVLRFPAYSQANPPAETRGSQPLYQVTIVSRTTKAINYGYLTAPTRIDFKGTPVLADARGEAVVEPKRGSTLLKIRFDHVSPPSRFGAQYLTYVVWAISPDGRAQNLGELTIDGSEKGKLTTSTPLQTFAMIVTAEPYYSVTQPSEVVVMENVVGRNTIGKIEEVNATYELLPRKPFTYDTGQAKVATRPVNQDQYEAITALYQALNAIQIAQSQNADEYAADRMTRARQIYEQARAYPSSQSKEVVSLAREATQVAEDARAIAVKRAEGEKLATEKLDAQKVIESQPTSRQVQPAPPAPRPTPPAAPSESTRGRQPVTSSSSREAAAIEVDHSQFMRDNPQARANRARLLSSMPRIFEVIDSGRGIVVTIPEELANAPALQANLEPVAAAIRPYKGLHIEVEGHTDAPNTVETTEREAERVSLALANAGIPRDLISIRGYGNTRPRTSNSNPASRGQNRRIEIVIAGDAIGILPTWDRTYTIHPGVAR